MAKITTYSLLAVLILNPAMSMAKPCGADGPLIATMDLKTEINEESIALALEGLGEAEAIGADYIVIRIDSGGGSVREGMKLATALQASPVKSVCIVDGKYAASMAAYILESCTERVMTDTSRLMFHRVSSMPQESMNARGLKDLANYMEALDESMVAFECRRLSISCEQFERLTDGHDYWLGAKSAKRIGAIDRIVHSAQEEIASLSKRKVCR